MYKKIKLGLTLVKYGFRPRTNLLTCIIFILIGLGVEIISKGTNVIGAFYLLLTSTYVYQMIISMDLSTLVQTSKMKRALQTTVPVVTGTALFLLIFTIIAVERLILAKLFPTEVKALADSTALVVLILFGAMLFMGACSKYFVGATVFFTVYVFAAMTMFNVLVRRGAINIGLTAAIIIGYAAIFAGGMVEYLLTRLLYKKELSRFAFKGLFGKLQ